MNILITGASGFIGKNLANFLEQKGHFVKGVSSADINLASLSSVENFIHSNAISFDVIVHGAFILCDSSQDMHLQMQDFKKNIEITENLITLVKHLKPSKLINLSSIAVYPNIDGTFSETSEIRPSVNAEGVYGLAKFCTENMCDLFLKNQNIFISHLRLGQVYGEGMREDRIFSIFKNELIAKNTVTVFGDGERISSFIGVDKVCSIIYSFFEKNCTGIYNIGEQNISYLELAQRTIKIFGNNSSKIVKIEKGSRSKFYLDCKKYKETYYKCSYDEYGKKNNLL